MLLSRLVEDADLRTTQDLFGSEVSLDDFVPKSAKDYEQYGRLLAQKYLAPHVKSSHYKSLLKTLLKDAVVSLDVQQVKDIETSVAGIRSEKLKEEKAKLATSKGAQRCCPPVHLLARPFLYDCLGEACLPPTMGCAPCAYEWVLHATLPMSNSALIVLCLTILMHIFIRAVVMSLNT